MRPPVSGAARRRRREWRTRAAFAVTLMIGGALTGWWWAHERVGGGTDGGEPAGWDVAGLVVGLAVVVVWAGALRAARPAPVAAAETSDGLPSTHSPAEVGWLLRHGRVTLADLAATVVDLTARGFVLPFARDDALVLGRGRPAVDVKAHETLLLDWLFADWAREADLSARQAAIRERPSLWADLWGRFVDEVEELGRDGGLIEREVASSGVLAVAATGLGILAAGVIGTAHGYPGWLACVVAGALVLAGASAFARRSPMGEELTRQWESFGRRLHDGTGLTPHALAYAVTLGEGQAAVERLAASDWPAQLVHDDVERRILGWREAYLTATSVRGEPSERLRAILSLRRLRRQAVPSPV